MRAARQILGHSLHEPERRVDLIQRLHVRAGLAARDDIELELVHHFVGEHVLEALQIAGHRKDHAVPERFGSAARSLAEIPEDVVLTELRARGEEDDRLLLAELVVEHFRQPRVGALRHAGSVHRALALFRVIVHLPVLGLDHSPIEMLVLHLVHPEVLLRVEASAEEQSDENHENPSRFHFCPTPVVPAPLFPHRSRVALSDRTREASDGRCELRNRRNRAAPSGPAVTPQCDAR